MTRATAAHGMLAFVLMVCVACAGGPIEDVKPGERPPTDSDEAGLWMVMERAEARLRSSGQVVQDPELNAYVREIVCRLASDYCGDIRTYVVRSAGFNASMAPNGTMHVWTGLLLRAENEAQLAYVLGHELAHYLRRHTLRRWRDARAKTNAAAFFNLASAVAGMGIVGLGVQLAAVGSILSFSRDQEREADEFGFAMMRAANYEGQEAAKIWEFLIREQEVSDKPERLIFFSTHPAPAERGRALRSLATEPGGETGRERFRGLTLGHRAEWLRDELRQRDFAATQVLLDHLLAADEGAAELHFFQGELYRLRGEDGDPEKAVAAYTQALVAGGAPVETHRSLGLVSWSLGHKEQARAAFESYLLAAPEASDRPMIEYYLEQLR